MKKGISKSIKNIVQHMKEVPTKKQYWKIENEIIKNKIEENQKRRKSIEMTPEKFNKEYDL